MKVTVQEKIAELESRIAALEQAQRSSAFTTTTRTVTTEAVSLEPEMGNVWDSVNALFRKAFK